MHYFLIIFIFGALTAPIFSEEVGTENRSPLAKNTIQENEEKTETEASWEAELEKDLSKQKGQADKFQNSRGFNSPMFMNPQSSDRSTQNLMMDIMAAVDTVGQWDKNKKKSTENRFDVREAEFGFSGAVDQWIRGNLLVAAHNEDGKYFFEIHEANAFFPFLSKYVTLKAGKMFLDLGRLNRIHRHDWIFTNAPIVHRKLMDKEAIADTGAELNFLLPWEKITQEIVLGATNGRVWGHTHSDGQAKNNPMMYLHLKNFVYLGDNWGTQFGFTAIRYEPDAKSNKTVRNQYGADFLLRWNRSFLKSFILTGELWYRETRFPQVMDTVTFQNKKTPMETQVGYYIFADYQFHQQWSLGFRFDYYKIPNLRDKFGYLAENAEMAYTPQVTYRPSEFSFIRLSVERKYTKDFTIDSGFLTVKSNEEWVKEFSENPKMEMSKQQMVTYQIYLQCTFILGAHPAHTY